MVLRSGTTLSRYFLLTKSTIVVFRAEINKAVTLQKFPLISPDAVHVLYNTSV